MSQSLCVSLFLSLSARTTSLNVVIVVVIQSLSHAQLFMIPWAAAGQASLSITNSQSLLKLMSIHRVGNAIQLSHPLSSPSPHAFTLSLYQGLFQ